MQKQIIKIDKEKCKGCGICVPACNGGAIGLQDGKAVLLRDDYCDGLGKCLQVCPFGAISFGTSEAKQDGAKTQISASTSQLRQWPVQIKLVPVIASYFENASLMITADCAAYAYGNFHNDFMKNRITLIGCPKLDNGDYSEKLTAILKTNGIKTVMVVRMEVPCCAGIENAVKTALKNCAKTLPFQVKTISTEGKLLD